MFKIGTHSCFTVDVPAVTIKPVCFSDPTKKTLLLRITMNKNMNLNYFFVFRFFFVTICVSLLPKVNIPKIVSDMNFSRFVCSWAQTLSERGTKVQNWNFYYCFENTQSETQTQCSFPKLMGSWVPIPEIPDIPDLTEAIMLYQRKGILKSRDSC